MDARAACPRLAAPRRKRLRPRRRLPGGRGCRPARRRARCGAPRRGRRAPAGRTVRHPGARRRRHRDRGRARRHADAGGRRVSLGPRPGHRVRHGDDHPQRHRRSLSPGRRSALPGAAFRAAGGERGPLDAGRHRGPDADPAGLHDLRPRARLHLSAAGLRGRRVARPVRDLRLRADRPSPRLLPPAGARRGERAPAAALDPGDAGERRAPARLARGGGPDGQGRVAGPRGGRRASRRAAGVRGHRHRGDRPAARGPVRGARRAREPPADEPQPRARLGARQHRPVDPRRGDRVDRERLAPDTRAGREVDRSPRPVDVRSPSSRSPPAAPRCCRGSSTSSCSPPTCS